LIQAVFFSPGGVVILEYKRVTKEYNNFDEFMRIYLESFPREEIIEIDILIGIAAKGYMRLEAVEDDGVVIGMHLTSTDTPATFIGFLAVDMGLRSRGYGSMILNELTSDGKPAFLNVEPPDAPCDNKKQRKARIDFYQRHGFKLTDYKIDLGTGIYRIMTNCEDSLDLYKKTISMLGFDWPITKSVQ